MTETEHLRSMLTKRGVEWEALSDQQEGEFIITATRWHDGEGGLLTMCIDETHGSTWDFFWYPTTEQAVEATLGRGEHEQRIYDRCLERVGQLEAENEKLRELVADMFGWYIKSECSSCEYRLDCHKLDRACDYMREFVPSMVELGIEVDE